MTDEKVHAFFKAIGEPIPTHPTARTDVSREVYARSVLLATLEYIRSCGLLVCVDGRSVSPDEVKVATDSRPRSIDLVGMATALGRLDFETSCAGVAFGFPTAAIREATFTSRMTVPYPDGTVKYTVDGAIAPGPHYIGPRIYEHLAYALRFGL